MEGPPEVGDRSIRVTPPLVSLTMRRVVGM